MTRIYSLARTAVLALGYLSLPVLVWAQGGPTGGPGPVPNQPLPQPQAAPQTPTDFASLVALLVNIINLLIPALFAVMFVFLMWKVIDAWIINAGDEQKVAAGRQYVLWGVLVLVLMIITWGVVVLIQTSFF